MFQQIYIILYIEFVLVIPLSHSNIFLLSKTLILTLSNLLLTQNRYIWITQRDLGNFKELGKASKIKKYLNYTFFNRPGVAGAVLQTPPSVLQ